LRKLAGQENTLKGLSGEATNSKERVNDKGEVNLRRTGHKVAEVKWIIASKPLLDAIDRASTLKWPISLGFVP
jgi:hypothetical protein